LLPVLEESLLKAGEDFYLAFSPERVDPANRIYRLRDIPKLVAGIDAGSTQKAADFYQKLFSTVIPLKSCKEAEMAKLLENTYRAVNIGLANEMAIIAHNMGIDFWNVIEAAATKPFGFTPFYPGPGTGGHCIPVDPLYLSWSARAQGSQAGFIDYADSVNRQMPGYVVRRVAELLDRHGKRVKDSSLLILGVAYKGDVADIRESPGLEIISHLAAAGANVAYHDPLVPSFTYIQKEWISETIDAALLARQDCAVIVADHSCFDYQYIVEHSNLVFDTRNATKKIKSGYAKIEAI
jgi:UDP-N-acetyl-D-glucosamine dehydrogenase